MIGALVPAVVGTGCCALPARRGLRAGVAPAAMVAMVAAMVDTMLLGDTLLPAYAWTGALACLGLVVVLVSDGVDRLRGLHLGVMALLVTCSAYLDGAGSGAAAMDMSAPATMAGASAAPASVALVAPAAMAVAVLFSGCALATLRLETPARTRVELVSSAVSTLAMAAMLL